MGASCRGYEQSPKRRRVPYTQTARASQTGRNVFAGPRTDTRSTAYPTHLLSELPAPDTPSTPSALFSITPDSPVPGSSGFLVGRDPGRVVRLPSANLSIHSPPTRIPGTIYDEVEKSPFQLHAPQHIVVATKTNTLHLVPGSIRRGFFQAHHVYRVSCLNPF